MNFLSEYREKKIRIFVVIQFRTLMELHHRSSQKWLQVALQHNPASLSHGFSTPSVDAFKTISESSSQVI